MEQTDVLVIGSGIAGLTYALEMAEHCSVTVLSKEAIAEGNSRYAQGGIASVTAPEDTFQYHIQDTLTAGAGLCDEAVVKLVIESAPDAIKFLANRGIDFDRSPGGELELAQEGGHSQRRILHVRDRTGADIHAGLSVLATTHPNIRFVAYQLAIDLIRTPSKGGNKKSIIAGAYVLDRHTNKISTYSARAVMIAAGGAGKVYLYTSNPDVATGDGIAMAYRAGARIRNMEFFQFHPTCLYHPQAKSFLITEAMRGEGARLLDPRGKQSFMERYDNRKELAPRDVVARAIDQEMKTHGYDYVLLDISHRDPDYLRARFPTIYQRTLEFGIDLTKDPIPVVPAAHYCCGGIVSDQWGRTDLERLYVAGESASTGLHGANRLASNSLLECVVFARRAAQHTREQLPTLSTHRQLPEWDSLGTRSSSEEVLVSYYWDEVRRLMWNLVGISRSVRRLELARSRLNLIQQEVADYYWRYAVTSDLVELRNILNVAGLIVDMARARCESRGLHFNTDFPQRDDQNFRNDSVRSVA